MRIKWADSMVFTIQSIPLGVPFLYMNKSSVGFIRNNSYMKQNDTAMSGYNVCCCQFLSWMCYYINERVDQKLQLLYKLSTWHLQLINRRLYSKELAEREGERQTLRKFDIVLHWALKIMFNCFETLCSSYLVFGNKQNARLSFTLSNWNIKLKMEAQNFSYKKFVQNSYISDHGRSSNQSMLMKES